GDSNDGRILADVDDHSRYVPHRWISQQSPQCEMDGFRACLGGTQQLGARRFTRGWKVEAEDGCGELADDHANPCPLIANSQTARVNLRVIALGRYIIGLGELSSGIPTPLRRILADAAGT